jgi:hypothetical protein
MVRPLAQQLSNDIGHLKFISDVSECLREGGREGVGE